MSNFHISRVSGNKKTGPIPVTTTSKDSCPTTCGFYSECYAKAGPLNLHWNKVTAGDKRALTEDQFLSGIKSLPRGQLYRHNQAGDLVQSAPGVIDTGFLNRLVRASKDKRGFTYSHHTLSAHNLKAIKDANSNGFTINLSTDTKKQGAETFKKYGLPTVAVLAIDAPNVEIVDGVKIVACPAEKSEKINCSNCALCAIPDRDYVIGFRAHGTFKKRANIIAIG